MQIKSGHKFQSLFKKKNLKKNVVLILQLDAITSFLYRWSVWLVRICLVARFYSPLLLQNHLLITVTFLWILKSCSFGWPIYHTFSKGKSSSLAPKQVSSLTLPPFEKLVAVQLGKRWKKQTCGENKTNYSGITKGEIWWGRYNLNWDLNKLAAAEDGSVSVF